MCAILVFMMQAGFMCLESGIIRNKNNINVALKNVSDLKLFYIYFACGHRAYACIMIVWILESSIILYLLSMLMTKDCPRHDLV